MKQNFDKARLNMMELALAVSYELLSVSVKAARMAGVDDELERTKMALDVVNVLRDTCTTLRDGVVAGFDEAETETQAETVPVLNQPYAPPPRCMHDILFSEPCAECEANRGATTFEQIMSASAEVNINRG